jgi:hypothetical protein
MKIGIQTYELRHSYPSSIVKVAQLREYLRLTGKKHPGHNDSKPRDGRYGGVRPMHGEAYNNVKSFNERPLFLLKGNHE